MIEKKESQEKGRKDKLQTGSDHAVITVSITRKAHILALMIEHAEEDGFFKLRKTELISLVMERKVMSGDYTVMRLTHEINRLETEGYIRKYFRVNEFKKRERKTMGIHYFYEFINFEQIISLLNNLPKILSQAELDQKIQILQQRREEDDAIARAGRREQRRTAD